jgi:hypothetical protein
MGIAGAVLSISFHLSVAAESAIVAVTGLIAGGAGSAVLLLFLTVVTFARAGTLAAAFLATGRNVLIAIICVLVIVQARRIVAALRERERLRRYVGRLRLATQAREWTPRSARAAISSP